jgi:hypothetical protein
LPPRQAADAGAVAALLRELLVGDERYRRQWQKYSRRRSSSLHQAAVAQVLALHLWDRGERSDAAVSLPRELKDRVSRALNGKTISVETLTWVIAAFAIDQVDQARLWETFDGYCDPRGVARTLRRQRQLARRQRHHTVSLFERYLVTGDRSLVMRSTAHTIQAAEEGVVAYIFNHEPAAEWIEVIYGGRLGERLQYGDGLQAVEIVLDHELRQWESTSLEYRTHFRAGTQFPTEVRRPAFARARNIDLAVQFDGAPPRRAWWCVWSDHVDGNPLQEAPETILGASIRRYVPFIEQTVVGFRWEW